MDNKDILSRTDKETNLGSNSDYYKYVFKKTEKIVCAVFYLIRADKDIDRTDIVVRNVEDVAHRVLRAAVASLKARGGEGEWATRELGYTLVELESSLKVASAAGFLEMQHLQVFQNELDTTLRTLKPYTEPKARNPFFDMSVLDMPARTHDRPRIKRQELRTLTEGNEDLLNPEERGGNEKAGRVERILAVLKDKGQASIKDISDVVTDCSEKTIQRELNNLIKDNKVIRDGQRRWSRYILVTTKL